jgi:hypothetical protein
MQRVTSKGATVGPLDQRPGPSPLHLVHPDACASGRTWRAQHRPQGASARAVGAFALNGRSMLGILDPRNVPGNTELGRDSRVEQRLHGT